MTSSGSSINHSKKQSSRRPSVDQLRFALRDAAVAQDNAAVKDAIAEWWKLNYDFKQLLKPVDNNVATEQQRRFSGYNVMHYATYGGSPAVVDNLLNTVPAFLEVKSARGRTPLMIAAIEGRVDVGEFLLSRGANMETVDNALGDTAMHFAAYFGHVSFVELLLRHSKGSSRRAMIEARNQLGSTPIHVAANGGHPAVIQVLLDAQADITAINKLGHGIDWYADRCDDAARRLEVQAFIAKLKTI